MMVAGTLKGVDVMPFLEFVEAEDILLLFLIFLLFGETLDKNILCLLILILLIKSNDELY